MHKNNRLISNGIQDERMNNLQKLLFSILMGPFPTASHFETYFFESKIGTIWSDRHYIKVSMGYRDYAWEYRFDGNAIVQNYLKFRTSTLKAVSDLWDGTRFIASRKWHQQNDKPQKVKNQGKR